MTGFDLAAVFLALTGAAGWLNARFWRLPPAAVMVLAGMSGAGLLLALRSLWPELESPRRLLDAIRALDFPKAVLGYILAFLLFAGAMQVNLAELGKRAFSVFSLATFGVAASIMIVGTGLWGVASILSLPLSLPWALVFGALISPTDPIAVLSVLRGGSVSKRIVAVLQGEALFNDGLGIVLFTALLAFAARSGDSQPLGAVATVVLEAGGGLLLGGAAGWIVIRAMRAIDDYAVEVGLTLALALGAYALASAVHVSAPIAVVVAGLMVGDRRRDKAMSDTTQRYIRAFWTLIDDILNAVLFLLLGLELLVVPVDLRLTGLWVASILLVLAARFIVVLPWGAYFRFRQREKGAPILLAWGGLHGALSLALALSLPPNDARSLILSTTFAVVIFSVLAQGLSFGSLAKRIAGRTADEADET